MSKRRNLSTLGVFISSGVSAQFSNWRSTALTDCSIISFSCGRFDDLAASFGPASSMNYDACVQVADMEMLRTSIWHSGICEVNRIISPIRDIFIEPQLAFVQYFDQKPHDLLRFGPSPNQAFIKRPLFEAQKEVRLILRPLPGIRSPSMCFINFDPAQGLLTSVPLATKEYALNVTTEFAGGAKTSHQLLRDSNLNGLLSQLEMHLMNNFGAEEDAYENFLRPIAVAYMFLNERGYCFAEMEDAISKAGATKNTFGLIVATRNYIHNFLAGSLRTPKKMIGPVKWS